jgi:predicted RNase H-like HicB family nuclease
MEHPTANAIYTVRAEWDDEAAVWVATSDDVPGLVTEAETLEELITKLHVMVPEMLELNGVLGAADAGRAAFRVIAERLEQPPRAVA